VKVDEMGRACSSRRELESIYIYIYRLFVGKAGEKKSEGRPRDRAGWYGLDSSGPG
jgi:hypothetical protein